MDDIKKLEVNYDIGAGKEIAKYAESRTSPILAYSAFILCGASIAVFLLRGADKELVSLAGDNVLSFMKNCGMIPLAAVLASFPTLCLISAIYSGFSSIPMLTPPLFSLLWGFISGMLCPILFTKSVTVCIAYSVFFLVSSLGITAAFSEGFIRRKNIKIFERRITDTLTLRSISDYISSMLVPAVVFLAAALAFSAFMNFM